MAYPNTQLETPSSSRYYSKHTAVGPNPIPAAPNLPCPKSDRLSTCPANILENPSSMG